jgi:hypothetical protein
MRRLVAPPGTIAPFVVKSAKKLRKELMKFSAPAPARMGEKTGYLRFSIFVTVICPLMRSGTKRMQHGS